jgi:predicted RNA methylase
MAIQVDAPSLAVFRRYLDDTMYAAIDLRLSLEIGLSRTGFPAFRALKEVVNRLGPVHQVLFRLFRFGETVEDRAFRHAIPEVISTALIHTGLLVRTKDNGWRTPNLLVIPAEGLAVLVSIPSSYPTATGPRDCWFDLSSYIFAKALPGSFIGLSVLDVCSGSGFLSLVCAARGATRVVGLEINAEAVAIAGATAVLNGLADKVEFRQSDMLASLKEGERFDVVVCNTPHAPQIEWPDAPLHLERVGTSLIWGLLDCLPAYLSERSRGFVTTWVSPSYQGSTYQAQAIFSRLEQEGYSAVAFVDPSPFSVDDFLRGLREDLEKQPGAESARVDRAVEGVRRLLQSPESPVDGFLNQLIYFQKGTNESAMAPWSVFGLKASALPAVA